MEVKIESGKFTFPVGCLLERLTLDEKKEMIQYLACDREIMDEVAAQIVDGMTSEGWHGPISYTASIVPHGGIEKARRLIAEKSSEIAAQEIERLKRAIESEKKLGMAGWDAYHAQNRRRDGINV